MSNARALLVLVVGILSLSHSRAEAQLVEADTIYFTIEKKQPGHIFYGMGSEYGYAVNGITGGTIAAVRGRRYVWNIRGVSSSVIPRIYNQPAGATVGRYFDIWDGDDISDGILYMRGEREDPDTLYYGAIDSLYFGGLILVVDSLPTTSVSSDQRRRSLAGLSATVTISPNPVTTTALFRISTSIVEPCRLEIVDLAGRLVRSEEVPIASSVRETAVRFDRGDLSAATYVWRLVRSSDDAPLSSGTIQIR